MFIKRYDAKNYNPIREIDFHHKRTEPPTAPAALIVDQSSSESENESDQSSRKRRRRHHHSDSVEVISLKNANIPTGPSGTPQQTGISLPSSIMNVLSQLPAASTYNCKSYYSKKKKKSFFFFCVSSFYANLNYFLVPVLDPARLVAFLRDLNLSGQQ